MAETKRTRKMSDHHVTYKTKKGKEYTAIFSGMRDCATALRMLAWFSSILSAGDKIASSVTVIRDRAKAVKVDELSILANELVD